MNNKVYSKADSCLPDRDFLQILTMESKESDGIGTLQYDPEWVAVLVKTHALLSTSRGRISVPEMVTAPTPEVVFI